MDPGFDDDFSPLQSGSNKESNGAVEGQSSLGGKMKKKMLVCLLHFFKTIGSSEDGSVQRSSPSPIRQQEAREEPEVIKKWRAEQAKHLEEKDRLEEEARVALKAQAKKELDDWYKQHSEQVRNYLNSL